MASSSSAKYEQLLEKTLLPVPAFQRLAVIAIFEKLRLEPDFHLDHGPARDAISRCLTSSSAPVVDQSVRELCRLPVPARRVLLELLSALDGCPSPALAPLLVKAIGLVSRRLPSLCLDHLQEFHQHPFVMVLSCKYVVFDEVLRQILLFVMQNLQNGVEVVFDFLHPILTFCVLKIPFSAEMGLFVKDLISSIAAMACSFPSEALDIVNYIVVYFKLFPYRDEKDMGLLLSCIDYMVDAYVKISKVLSKDEKTKTCCLLLLETLVSFPVNYGRHFNGSDVGELSQRLLVAYRELGLNYSSEFVMITLSLSLLLSRSEFEHEQLCLLKLLIYMIQWKLDSERRNSFSIQEILLFFPVVNLLSSPSKSIKAAATQMLSMLERCLGDSLVYIDKIGSSYIKVLAVCKPEIVVSRFLHYIWFQEQAFQSCMDIFDIISAQNTPGHHDMKLVSWIYEFSGKSFSAVESKLRMASRSTVAQCSADHLLLSFVSTILIMHPKIGSFAADFLASVCCNQPGASMPLFLTILLYSKIFCSSKCSSEILIRFMEMLPSLASQPLMLPLVLQTISPMLKKNVNSSLNAIGTRLLCKTWETADKCFGSLQEVLAKEDSYSLMKRMDISLSVAASVCDVCKCNPDRGVDLVDLVSLFIESHDSVMQAFGLESLSHLCEADVVDFYTAWKVIAKSVQNYVAHPVIARSLGILLRWGAMDVEAYPEDSKYVIQILWDIATSRSSRSNSRWLKARVAAFQSLVHYEVGAIRNSVSNFNKMNMELFTKEDSPEVLNVLEQFEVNVINFEHITRRRLIKEKRPPSHKVEKLLDLLPQAILTSENGVQEFPGALLNFTPKELLGNRTLKDLPRLHAVYEHKLLEVADCLQLPRNYLFALLALQSWKAFVTSWMRSISLLTDSKSQLVDGSPKAVMEIFKILMRCAECSIPRVAENIVLAIGAFFMVLKSSTHSIASCASSFLSQWLQQFEHEHKQWASAISLGLLSNYLHATDRTHKHEIMVLLIKVMGESGSFFVKGACAIGLGLACQDLLTTAHLEGKSNFEESILQNEAALLRKTIRSLCLLISSVQPSTSNFFNNLFCDFPMEIAEEVYDHLSFEKPAILEEKPGEFSGMAGVVIGLGQAAGAVYRLGTYDILLKIREFMLSCIHVQGSFLQNYSFEESPMVALSMGASIVLPTVTAFCEKAELVHGEMHGVLSAYREMIGFLLGTKKSRRDHQYLLMASCFGSGTLIYFILNDGLQTLKTDDVKGTLEDIRTAYTGTSTPIVAFGGMLGVVNAFGAGAGLFLPETSAPNSFSLGNHSQETTYISEPLLSSHALEQFSTSIIQEVFMLAKDCESQQTKGYAAWALSFLRHRWWLREHNVEGLKSISQKFSSESLVWNLYLWLSRLLGSEVDISMNMHNVMVALKCLGKAPRIPVSSDWGRIVRYFMKQAAMSCRRSLLESSCKLLREECISFCIQHANNVEPLLLFLDEIMDLPRFSRLEENLQQFLLERFCAILKVFHESRKKKLFSDLIEFISSSNSLYATYQPHQSCLMRISFWKGLFHCLSELSDNLECTPFLEQCMEALFSQFPMLALDENHANVKEELLEAIKCFGISRPSWLKNLLQIGMIEHETGGRFSSEVMIRFLATARLVSMGHVLISELRMLKAYLFDSKNEGCWRVLIEVAVAVFLSEGNTRRQWLIDAVDISIVSPYPSVALQFVGILSALCCKYRPFLPIEPDSALSDLPITLPSLLMDSNWTSLRKPLALKLWLLTERLCTWASHLQNGYDMGQSVDGIDASENQFSHLLACVSSQVCLFFKEHLPFEQQLKLADILTSRTWNNVLQLRRSIHGSTILNLVQ